MAIVPTVDLRLPLAHRMPSPDPQPVCYPPGVGYLVLQIVGNAAFTLFVRVARHQKFDYLLVGATNYAVAAAVSLALLLHAPTPASPAVILYGMINGLQYQVTFLLMYAMLSMTGVAVMTSFLRLSVFIPTIASIAIWSEFPSPIQAVGLALTALALPLLGTAAGRTAPAKWRSWRPVALIVTTMLFSGAGLLAAKAFSELHLEAQRPVYLVAAYGTATVLSALTWPLRPRLERTPSVRGIWPAFGLGMITGLCNIGQLAAFLRGLAVVPGIIAFPVTAAGGLLVVTVFGRLAWNERIAGRAGAGIVLALAAVVLVNA
jgi:drug/metabolite transporter (DMT)-like permease